MALSTITLSARLGDNFAKETVATSTKSVVSASSLTLFGVEINNSGNSADASYVKCFDKATGAVTVGTTDPELILVATAGATVTYMFDQGISFATGLVLACVTGAGTAGTGDPSSSVVVKLIYT